MAQPRLLQSVCAVALMAAAPAFAQTSTQPADTGPNNSVNAPAMHSAAPPASGIAPAEHMGTHADSARSHAMHHMAMNHGRSRSDTSQNAAVDQLNDQSLQAAQRGQAFGMSDMTGTTGPTTMPGGTTGPANAASGAGGGAGGAGSR
jgi:hypothetical protein